MNNFTAWSGDEMFDYMGIRERRDVSYYTLYNMFLAYYSAFSCSLSSSLQIYIHIYSLAFFVYSISYFLENVETTQTIFVGLRAIILYFLAVLRYIPVLVQSRFCYGWPISLFSHLHKPLFSCHLHLNLKFIYINIYKFQHN